MSREIDEKRPALSRSRFLSDLVATVSIACIGMALVAAALQWRSPGLVQRWPMPQAVLVVVALAALAGATGLTRRHRILGPLAGLLPVIAVVIASVATDRAASLRAHVLSLPPDRLHAAAGHVIAGFYDMEEARRLAGAGIGGLFLSPRNVRGLSEETITSEIAELQTIRRKAGLPPLWIAVDQEGGLVATLSPPLPRPKAFATFSHDDAALSKEASSAAADLARLGVNVNFAPVVDVSRGRLDPSDHNSRIALRSLSSDPAVVAHGAESYCRALMAQKIQCTIKHFPGLGDVTEDTHVSIVHRPTIQQPDLAPFKALTRADGPHPWIMLSHLVIDDLDKDHPASASASLIAIIRQQFGYDGLLVTDDAAMMVYAKHLAENAVATVAGGGDFVLASYDPDLAFGVVAALADDRSDALANALHASDLRIARASAAGRTP